MEPTTPNNLPGRPITFTGGGDIKDLAATMEPDGRVWTRWTLTDRERLAVAAGGDIVLSVLTFGQGLPPLAMAVAGVDDLA